MKEYDDTIPKVPLWKVLRLNAKEWPLLLLGAVGSIFEGATFPMFAIIIGEILRVREHNYECYLHDRVNCSQFTPIPCHTPNMLWSSCSEWCALEEWNCCRMLDCVTVSTRPCLLVASALVHVWCLYTHVRTNIGAPAKKPIARYLDVVINPLCPWDLCGHWCVLQSEDSRMFFCWPHASMVDFVHLIT